MFSAENNSLFIIIKGNFKISSKNYRWFIAKRAQQISFKTLKESMHQNKKVPKKVNYLPCALPRSLFFGFPFFLVAGSSQQRK